MRLMQTALLSARTDEKSHIADALTTLNVTNLAYCAITVYQAFIKPQIALYE
jgi:hypothetical protein